MTVNLGENLIVLEGECHVEDAEILTGFLQSNANAPVDLSQCRRLHSAVLQALLSFAPAVAAYPSDERLSDVLRRALTLARAGA